MNQRMSQLVSDACSSPLGLLEHMLVHLDKSGREVLEQHTQALVLALMPPREHNPNQTTQQVYNI